MQTPSLLTPSRMYRHFVLIASLVLFPFFAVLPGQSIENIFAPLESEIPAPNEQRLASGVPGPDYWQQRADYDMKIELDEAYQTITGEVEITYYNNSPHALDYLWLQLDQNIRASTSLAQRMKSAPRYGKNTSFDSFNRAHHEFEGGITLSAVETGKETQLSFKIVDTNLRIDLPESLAAGKKIQFRIKWDYPINDATLGGRSGYEYFERDNNQVFEIAQFYPRMCVYDAIRGWQNQPFLGPAEFALEFGDYTVAITVPSDHIVAATGTLQNRTEVLPEIIQNRLLQAAAQQDSVIQIITPEEAELKEAIRKEETQTWVFEAENVRDFAFASSRKFIWDAASVQFGERTVMAHSLYPSEGMPLWNTYGIHAVLHTLDSYSKYLIDYPYPQATAIHGPVWGMEYPMMAFCGGRPQPDGTYSRKLKYAMISVIIHEVGHNWFPMVINNDERSWAWMDEGFNSFYQFITEQDFEPNYASRRGIPGKLAPYLARLKRDPIMRSSENISQGSRTTYEKTAVGLNMLRETIMGRDAFDETMKAYAEKWAFKHPEPADFFRFMNDHSGINLDWFWRSWFFNTAPIDMSIKSITQYKIDKGDPDSKRVQKIIREQESRKSLTQQRSKQNISEYYVYDKPELEDFYSEVDPHEVSELDRQVYSTYLELLEEEELSALTFSKLIYQVEIENVGGCIAPIRLEIEYVDGSLEELTLPVEIWIKNAPTFKKEIVREKEIVSMRLDPKLELPDIDRSNDKFDQAIPITLIHLYKPAQPANEMQKK